MMIDYLSVETHSAFSARIEKVVQNGIMNKTLKPHSVETFKNLAWQQVNEALYNNSCENILKGLDDLVRQSEIGNREVNS